MDEEWMDGLTFGTGASWAEVAEILEAENDDVA